MRAQQLPNGNFRISISDGFDENGKRVYKSFTADAEWKAIKLAEDYKKLKKKSGEKNKRKRKVQEPDETHFHGFSLSGHLRLRRFQAVFPCSTSSS